MSSRDARWRGFFPVRPCGRFVVEGARLQASVQDADEPVRQPAQGVVVLDAAVAEAVVVGTGAGRGVQRGEGLDHERVDEPVVMDEPGGDDLLLPRREGDRAGGQMYVAGAPAKQPRYRFACQVPEGQYNDERRAAVTAAMIQAVVEAEDGSWPHPELRVIVFTNEIKDGTLGGAGRILRLPDIYELAWPPKPGMDGEPRETADQVLAERRRQEAELLIPTDDP